MQITRNEDGTLDAYAWPGGYQLFYVDHAGNIFCPNCAAVEHTAGECLEADWCGSNHLEACDANYEDEDMRCENCNGLIPASYADEEPLTDWRDASQAKQASSG